MIFCLIVSLSFGLALAWNCNYTVLAVQGLHRVYINTVLAVQGLIRVYINTVLAVQGLDRLYIHTVLAVQGLNRIGLCDLSALRWQYVLPRSSSGDKSEKKGDEVIFWLGYTYDPPPPSPRSGHYVERASLTHCHPLTEVGLQFMRYFVLVLILI